jgi:hypothetical protein
MIRWTKTGYGIMSSDGKYSISPRGWLGGGVLNWALYDHTEETYLDGFRYQRDAKAEAEIWASLYTESINKKAPQSYYRTLLKRLTKS